MKFTIFKYQIPFLRLIKKAKQFRRLRKLLRHRNDDFSELGKIKSSEEINYTTPWSIIASATFKNPPIFAPLT